MKLKLKMSMKILAAIKKYLASKYYDDSNILIIGKMKKETEGVVIEEFVGLKPKMHSFFVNYNEHKIEKDVNKNVVVTIRYNEYKDDLLNSKCMRLSMNRIQSNDLRIGTYEIRKDSLPRFDDKIYIQNNRYDRLVLRY